MIALTVFVLYIIIRGTEQPEPVTLTSLGTVGGSTNTHLTITHFRPGNGILISERHDGTWDRVWIPLLNPAGRWTERPVVAHSPRIANAAELRTLLQRNAITGVVTNGIQNFAGSQRDQFALAYPEKDMSDPIAFEIGRPFPQWYVTIPLTLAGVTMLATGATLAIRMRRSAS